MRVFVAGGSGAIGRQLFPILLAAGHSVFGMTRTASKAEAVRSVGAGPVVAGAFDAAGGNAAVPRAPPGVIVPEMTAISPSAGVRNLDRDLAVTNRLRTEGTRNLIRAAVAAKARRFIAQSFAGWPFAREGGPVKTEDGPFDPNPPKKARQTLGAIRQLEAMVTTADGLEGVVLRYGGFYGPGTSISQDGTIIEMVRRRRLPIVGSGAGIWSFVHITDAAAATGIAVERGMPGIYNIVDDDPAPVSEWLPGLAAAVGAKPPYRIPAWLGRLVIGNQGLAMMTESRGGSNTKAKRELGWEPAFASWRDGFRRGLGRTP